MKLYTKSIALVFFFLLSVTFLYAQDTLKINKAKRNALKLGTPLIPAKIFFSYEHAFNKHISLGGMVSYGGGNFLGYTCNLFSRYYFERFDNSGWFVEARGSYGYYNQYVYSDIGYPNYPYETREYTGKHHADIHYWNAGVSGGYKIFPKAYGRVFFEFLAGLHYGKATFGANDRYIQRYGIAYELGSDNVQEVFDNSGPGFPLHFVINFGFAF